MTTQTFAEPLTNGQRHRQGLIARHVVTGLAALELWDVMLLLGAALLLAGLWLTFGLGPALIAGGALLLLGGIVGGNGKALASARGGG